MRTSTFVHLIRTTSAIGIALLSTGCSVEAASGDSSTSDEVSTASDEIVGSTSQALAGSCGVASCASWSAWTNSGAPFCGGQACVVHTYPEWTVYPGKAQKQERFRYCTLSNGTTCKETETRNVKIGCCPRTEDD